MFLQLTDLSDEPLQGQIVRQIRAKILAGELQPGTDLPSIRKLAREQHVSVITVERAYKILERDGLIHSRQRKGFFVSKVTEKGRKKMAKGKMKEALEPKIRSALAEGLDEEEINQIVWDIFQEIKSNRGGKE